MSPSIDQSIRCGPRWSGHAAVLFATLLTMALLVFLLPAAAQGETIYGLVTVNWVEMCAGPDFAYSSIGQLPLDASVVVLGRARDFCTRWDGSQRVRVRAKILRG